jgi:hypothetical protein
LPPAKGVAFAGYALPSYVAISADIGFVAAGERRDFCRLRREYLAA